jgi:hypothetical protein
MREIVLTRQQFDGLSRAVREAGGCLHFEPPGFSMYLLLQTNDELTIRPTDTAESAPKAIVLCRSVPEGLAVHRIGCGDGIESPRNCLIFIRGDASPAGAELLSNDDVLGIISQVASGPKALPVNRGPWTVLGRALAHLRSILSWATAPCGLLRRAGGPLMRRIQGQAVYRAIMHDIVAHRVTYDVPSSTSSQEEPGHFLGPGAAGIPSLETILTGLRGSSGRIYVISALLGKREVGSVKLTRSLVNSLYDSDWWLTDLMVWPFLRGAGVGEQLVRRATELAVSEGAARLSLLVNAGNQPAVDLYRKLGFQDRPAPLHVAKMAGIFPGGNPGLKVMSLALTRDPGGAES